MRLDADGNELHQVSLWLPAELARLMRADGMNVSRFIRDQLEILYGDPSGNLRDQRSRLVQAARESFARPRQAKQEREAERERAREAVRQMRARHEAPRARQEGIADALLQIIGDGPPDRYRRMLPEDDRDSDRLDDWEALVRRVSHLCDAKLDSAEVAAVLRALVAAA